MYKSMAKLTGTKNLFTNLIVTITLTFIFTSTLALASNVIINI